MQLVEKKFTLYVMKMWSLIQEVPMWKIARISGGQGLCHFSLA